MKDCAGLIVREIIKLNVTGGLGEKETHERRYVDFWGREADDWVLLKVGGSVVNQIIRGFDEGFGLISKCSLPVYLTRTLLILHPSHD